MKPTFRSSESDRVLLCNGSITLVPLVEPRVGDDGIEGSAIHHDSAVRIIRDLGGSCEGDLPMPDPSWPTLRFSKWIGEFYTRHIAETAPEGWSLECEVPLAFEFERFILSGHIDCLAVSPDATQCIGYDLKTGYNYVDAAECNEQVFSYCGLLKLAYPTLQRIEFYVTQPRADEDEGFERITHVVLEGERLENSLATIERRFNAALDNRMELNTGRTQCKWCPAAISCPALIIERDQMKLQLTPEAIAQIKRQPEDTTLGDWILAGKTLARPIEDAQELAKERIAKTGALVASDGTQITVKVSPGSYKILDKLGMWKAVAELLPEERRAVAAKWSMTELDDQIAEQFSVPKGGKGAVTGRTIRTDKTAAFVEQGERKTFQYL